MKKFIFLPFIAILLFIAAIAEPSLGGEIAWVWWLISILGGFSFAGWLLGKGRGR